MTDGFGSDSLPEVIPVFPLSGAVLLPRGTLPLNIFEPRYLAMVRDAMKGDRLIGMIQPRAKSPEPPPLYDIGCVGRITQYSETGDGRLLIALTGLSRFRIDRELAVITPYRQVVADYAAWAGDWATPAPLPAAVRADLEGSLRSYLDAMGMSADWDAVANADDESLVNTLAAVCPFDAVEKQALIETGSMLERAHTLSALMAFAGSSGEDDDSKPTLQ